MLKAPLIAILVEDSRTIRETLVPALEELGHTQVVSCATTSKEAASALAEWDSRWELIIVDLFLAAGSGLDVLKQVQFRLPTQHAIVLSNYATDEMRRRCKELGANGIFDKSTEIDLFLDRCLTLSEMR